MKINFQNLYMAIFKPREKLLEEKVKYWIEEEFIYVYPDYSLELLAEKTGANTLTIEMMLLRLYKKSFYPLKRSLRVMFLQQTAIDEPESTLQDFVLYGGYEEIDHMLDDIKKETGLDFEEFIKYSQELGGRDNC
ncbi:hypothetical protein SAMN06295967_1263 [Belliella buryatensis]|uniref:HTH araC/xylS-type domain-containing protein n=1 Tax=Belliella buryatensis TaxID=1500549 RepID=A0A239H6W9_9BACT|nr:hypothetical protein [Belliella buryatensis]SNS76778.1 hypothetical protein SAMN06295967_1263 [Belliella buryatensis]